MNDPNDLIGKLDAIKRADFMRRAFHHEPQQPPKGPLPLSPFLLLKRKVNPLKATLGEHIWPSTYDQSSPVGGGGLTAGSSGMDDQH